MVIARPAYIVSYQTLGREKKVGNITTAIRIAILNLKNSFNYVYDLQTEKATTICFK